MRTGLETLPRAVAREVLSIIERLLEKGWQVSSHRYDPKSFGNWYVDLVRLGLEIRVVKDRSQFFVTGPSMDDLQGAGLGHSFDDPERFRQVLIAWDTSPPPK